MAPDNDPPDRKLPEEFAPTGPKLSRFRIQPAPPIRPRLFPAELAFAARLAVLCGAAELAAWAALGRALVERREPLRHALLWAALGAGALRTLRPLWGWLGARIPRPLVAGLLLLCALIVCGAFLGLPVRAVEVPLWVVVVALALPAVGDLAASTVADAITVDRRPAAWSALEMGQGLGLVAGLAIGAASPRALFVFVPPAALVAAGIALRDLRDRGTPRSSWPLELRLRALLSVRTEALLALATGALGAAALARSLGTTLAGEALPLWGTAGWLLLPLVGMAAFARLEAAAPAKALALRLCAVLAAIALVAAPWSEAAGGSIALFALGGAAGALPAAVLRAAAEMERAAASSACWSALALGAGLGALAGLL